MNDQNEKFIPFMRECFALAQRGLSSVSPNPMVGAVLIKDDRVVGRGWHKRFGGPHAEIECLKDFGEDARGATMVVNLEPCSHTGKTPPCADALVAAGIARVVVAMKDPNPLVTGSGIRRLRKAGIDVVTGVLREEARFLNRRFVGSIADRTPYVHVKIAQSLDGRINGGKSQWISSPESQKLVHLWRSSHDAIVVGAGTILADNPRLTVRHIRGADPSVVIIDRRMRMRGDELVFRKPGSRRVMVITSAQSLRRSPKARLLARKGIEVLGIDSRSEHLPLDAVLSYVRESGIHSVLVEGGARVFGDLVVGGYADELSIFVSPALHGVGLPAFGTGFRQASRTTAHPQFRTMWHETSGRDVLLRAFRESYRAGIQTHFPVTV
jgi:diaminohydroxyphosphoribosylaminopyrimidine deaminase/5-amino-6-(5-phosphoribosylamino)uracil reductase